MACTTCVATPIPASVELLQISINSRRAAERGTNHHYNSKAHHQSNVMKAIPFMVALATLTPLPMLATTTPDKADIDATGTAPTFCTTANEGGAISMAISTAGEQLSGNGSFSHVANGNSKVVLSQINKLPPKEPQHQSPTSRSLISSATDPPVLKQPALHRAALLAKRALSQHQFFRTTQPDC